MKMAPEVFLLFVFIFVLTAPAFCAGFIVENGRSDYKIVLPKNPDPAEETAASELSEHIFLMTGVRIPVENTESSAKPIYIGLNHSLPSDLKKYKDMPLAAEEILIASDKSGSALLCGGSPRGTLYAVYEYLHQLGVRFYTPTFTKYPTNVKNIAVPTRYKFRPPARLRSMALGNDPTHQWTARNRLNSIALWGNLPKEYGFGVPEGPDMHTFWRLVPTGIFNDNPDWAAMVDGKRLPPAGNIQWGICLNPEARKFIADRTVDWSNKHPDYPTVWMGINDGSPYCSCPYCTEFYSKHGGQPSSLVMQLANEIADRLPDKMVKTLAYSWTADPPENFKLRDNVIVMFCPTADPNYSIPKGSTGKLWADRHKKWQRVSKNMSVYLYPFPASNYWFPSPSIFPGAESIRWASDSGISDLYAQISGFAGSRGSDALDLRAWVYARMMWDPKSNPRALVREFCKDNYTVAADDVMQVIDLLHSDSWKESASTTEHSFVLPDYVDPVGVAQANNILEKAYQRFGEGDQDARDRFETFWISYLWGDLWANFEGLGKYNDNTRSWSVPLANGKTGTRRAGIVKSLMIKHGANGLSERVRLNPNELRIDKFGSEWEAAKLDDGNTSLVVVAGISGNVSEWKDKSTGFTPLKEAWFFTILQYPLFSAWREQVNGAYIGNYQIVNKSDTETELRGSTSGKVVNKKVSIKDGTVTTTLSHAGEGSILTTIMMDMNDDCFGTSPTFCILKNDGSWSKERPGDGLGDFWYASKGLDTSSAVGTIVVYDSNKSKGVRYNLQMDEVESVSVEYDRLKHPAELGKMVQLMIKSKNNSSLTIKAKMLYSKDLDDLKL